MAMSAARQLQTYIIEIDEEQRLFLVQAMNIMKTFAAVQPKKVLKRRDSQLMVACTEDFAGMLEDLPAQERATPKAIHGFCY